MTLAVPTRAKSTAGVVVESLRQAILRGDLKANQPIRQQDIADQLGVSVIPVREALMVLEGEGLVTIFPNRGAVVSSLSVAEADEIYEMRLALETLALRHALPNQTEQDWRRAEAILSEIDAVRDPLQWSELNWEFHATLYRPAALPRVLGLLQALYNNVTRYFVIYDTLDYHDEPQRAHRAILAACRARDIATATTLLEEHLHASVRSLRTYLTPSE
jgi:DNA-binding GntR family transcriptional regulator